MDHTQAVTIDAKYGSGHILGSTVLDVLDDEKYLEVAVDKEGMSENGGVSMATVTRYRSNGDLPVTLQSDDESEATVTNVFIPAGQSFATFEVTALDDLVYDGKKAVTITANATDHVYGTDTIIIHDDEALMFRMKIALSGYDKAETLTNFPVLVRLSENLDGFSYSQFASTNGWDLRFRDATDSQDLVYEVETWDVGGETIVWVQVPELTNNVYVWAYWGAFSNAAAPAVYTTNGAVWADNNYVGVWHMADTSVFDYTRNGNNGLSEGNFNRTGNIGVGQGLDGIGADYLGVQSNYKLPIYNNGNSNRFSVSLWMNCPSDNAGDLFEESSRAYGDPLFSLRSGWLDYPTSFAVRILDDIGTDLLSGDETASTYPVFNSKWHHVAWVEDNGNVKVYLDGLERDPGKYNYTRSGTTSNMQVTTFISTRSENIVRCENSTVDEARISCDLRSPNWVFACYSNQVSGSAFCAYETVESLRPDLSMVLDSGVLSENGESVSGTVTREGTDLDLIVTLESSDITEAIVPGTVKITNGYDSATFMINPVDDSTNDGPQAVTITATADGYNPDDDTIEVLDDEAFLEVLIDLASIGESGGTSDATVTRFNSTGDLEVALASLDPTEANVEPASVIINNGQDSAVFIVNAVNDDLDDDDQVVTITATATDHFDGSDTITVIDDDFDSCKMKITFSGYEKGTTLTNFPALVIMNEGLTNFLYSQFASTNGWDLRFKDATETTDLNYETEDWNDAGGDSYVWVQVPELTNGSAIWAYWGDPSLTNSPAPCTTNGATWSDEFAGVWHMTEANAIDSTTNGNTGVAGGSAGVSVLTGGQIGSAIDFPPNASGKGYIGFPGGGSLLMGQSFTFSTWVRWDGSGNPGYCMVASKKNEYNHSDGWCIETHSDNHNVKTLGSSGGGPELDVTVNSVWTDHNWVYLTCVYNGSSVSVYADGGLVGSGGIATVVENAGRDLVLGNDCGYEENNFDGPMDEARCVKALRSADWIWACYSNQVDGSTFCSYDDVEVVGGEQTTTNGTPYAWLESHGITNNHETADISDPDGDGALTWEEYQAGTDPTNYSSVFAVFDMSFQGASNCIVWYGTTNSGATNPFVIYRATDLLTPVWTPVSTNPRSATGTNIWWDDNPPQDAPILYRPALP